MDYVIIDSYELPINSHITLIGRIIALRNDGLFFDLMDYTGVIQCFHQKDASIKLGYVVRVSGVLVLDKKENIRLNIKAILSICENTVAFPKLFFGVKSGNNEDLYFLLNRFQFRVSDLRIQLIQKVRNFLTNKRFVEFTTPTLCKYFGGALATPFTTKYHAKDNNVFLKIAPELFLKRYLILGYDRVFEISECFRNEGISIKHMPQFTMLELYAANVEFSENLEFSKNFVNMVCEFTIEYFKNMQIKCKREIEVFEMESKIQDVIEKCEHIIKTQWQVIEFTATLQAIYQKYDLHFDVLEDAKLHVDFVLMKENLQIPDQDVNEKMLALVEKHAHKFDKSIIKFHPAAISPLAKHEGEIAKRFEMFIRDVEVANGFEENTDARIQEINFIKTGNEYDRDFIAAMQLGLVDCSGVGLGIDRLIFCITGIANIRDSRPFVI